MSACRGAMGHSTETFGAKMFFRCASGSLVKLSSSALRRSRWQPQKSTSTAESELATRILRQVSPEIFGHERMPMWCCIA